MKGYWQKEKRLERMERVVKSGRRGEGMGGEERGGRGRERMEGEGGEGRGGEERGGEGRGRRGEGRRGERRGGEGRGLHGGKSLRALPSIVLGHEVSVVQCCVVELIEGDEGGEGEVVGSICRGSGKREWAGGRKGGAKEREGGRRGGQKGEREGQGEG